MVHPLITLYSAEEQKFETNGLGSLGEATKCNVTEEANGQFELEMTYPIYGRRFDDLKLRNIIYTKPNPVDPPQGFRIYEISKPMNGHVTIYAAHLRYDLTGFPVSNFEAETCLAAMDGLKSHSILPHPFQFLTDKETSGTFYVDKPTETTTLLGGSEGSILDVYGGEYKFDNFTVHLYNHRGMDRGVVIRYGKNLTNFKQEENCGNVYTHVLPYWTNEDSIVTLSDYVIPTGGTYDFTNVYILDLSSEFEDPPLESDLIEVANEYIANSDFGVPKVSLDVSFAQLEQTEEYKDYVLLEQVELFDTVTVEFPEMNVSATAKVNKTVYNALIGRYESVSLGDVRTNISDTIISQGQITEQEIDNTKTFLEKSVERATWWITNGKGYMVAVKDEAGNWTEICSLDRPNIQEALNVWRWNNGGFGHSSNGYNGPFTTAITQDGHIVANFIDVGVLTASIIQAGILKDIKTLGDIFYLDLENGVLKMNATELRISSKTVPEISQEKAKESIDNFISETYDPKIAELQKQLDGQIESFYYDYEPKLTNVPASDWKTEEDRQKHEGDLFYWKTKGYAYRFFKSGTAWMWQMIQDTDITQAIGQAAAAQDTADHKRRVFVSTPTVPYDVGDLWVQGENGDILRCRTSKSSSQSYSANDWIKASKYTDDSVLTDFLKNTYAEDIKNLETQADKKAETWYQTSDPSTSWTTSTERSEHIGDLWYNSSSSVQKYYRWNGSSWSELKTTPPDAVFNQINGKAQVFVSTPTVPYYKGDLWFNSTSSDIKVSTTTRTSGSYYASDWVKRDQYINSAAATKAADDAVNSAMSQKNILDKMSPGGEIYLSGGKLYVTFSAMKGGSLYLGGYQDGNGLLVVQNSSGSEIGRWDHNGITSKAGKLTSNNGLVYFDLDNNELRCTRLIGGDTSGFTSIADLGDVGSGWSNQARFRIFCKTASQTESNAISSSIVLASTPNSSKGSMEFGSKIKNFQYMNGNSILSLRSDNGVAQLANFESQTARIAVDGNSGAVGFHGTATAHDGLKVSGTFTVSGGNKSRIVDTENYGARTQYAYEMPSPMFGDVGQGLINDQGECYVFLDDIFLETVSTDIEYQVFLQKEGPGDLWVDEKTPQYFVVKGTELLKFAWEVKVVQREYEFESLDEFEIAPPDNEMDSISRSADDRIEIDTTRAWDDFLNLEDDPQIEAYVEFLESFNEDDKAMDNYILYMEQLDNPNESMESYILDIEDFEKRSEKYVKEMEEKVYDTN